jgi:uncharacterized membrane protein YkgB
VLFWIGAMKFTAYEAAGIEPFVANSLLMSWLYALLSVQGVSNLLGVVEIATAGLILLGPISPLSGALGGALATGTFLTTSIQNIHAAWPAWPIERTTSFWRGFSRFRM